MGHNGTFAGRVSMSAFLPIADVSGRGSTIYSFPRTLARLVWMVVNPVPGDVNPSTHPDVIQRIDIIKQPGESVRARRVADDPHV